MKTKKTLFFILVVFALIRSSYAKTLRIAVMDLPQTYEPITVVKPVERLVASLLYNGLIRKTYQEDENGTMVFDYIPMLAKEFWPVDESGKRTDEQVSLHWQFALRQNIFWYRPDGVKKRFTASDVLYTGTVINDPSTSPKDELLYAYLKPAPIEKDQPLFAPVQVKSPFLVQINLNHAAYKPQRFLSFPIVQEIPDTTGWNRSKNKDYQYKFNPVGTGYYFLEKRTSRVLNFQKNQNSWEWQEQKEAKNIDSVVITKFDDRRSMIKACFFNPERPDAIDLVNEILPDEIPAFEEDKDHYTSELNMYNFYYIGVNFGGSGALSKTLGAIKNDLLNEVGNERFDKEYQKISLGIREAMLMGLSRESMLKVYGEYPGEVLSGPYVSGVWAYTNQGKKKRSYSPQEAKEVLKSIGFDRGAWKNNKSLFLKFRLSYKQGDPYYEKITYQIVDEMKNIGIQIVPIGVPEAAFDREIYKDKNFDLVLGKYLYREDMDVTQFFSASNGFLGFQTEQLDEYVAKLRGSQLRKDEIQGLYQAMDRFLWNNLPVIFLWSLNECVGVRKNLQETTKASKRLENIKVFDGYDFFGNIPRWMLTN